MTDDRTVVAQGTFDIVHPGHIHYLEESAALGDRLVAIVARSSNVDHKEPPLLPATQRRRVIASMEAVDEARLGHQEDIYVPIEEIDPDIITLGYDQHHDEAAIEAELDRRGIDCEVVRIGPFEPTEPGLYSTGAIVDEIARRRSEHSAIDG